MPNINRNKPIKTTELKVNDIMVFVDAGEWKKIDFSKAKDGSNIKEVFEIGVSLNGADERRFVLNETSKANLSPKWGGNSEGWVGKKAKVGFVKMLTFGEMKNVLMLEPLTKEEEAKFPEKLWEEA